MNSIKMKAVITTKYGGPEVLKLEQVPVPIPKEKEVLVRIRVKSSSRSDGAMKSHRRKY